MADQMLIASSVRENLKEVSIHVFFLISTLKGLYVYIWPLDNLCLDSRLWLFEFNNSRNAVILVFSKDDLLRLKDS